MIKKNFQTKKLVVKPEFKGLRLDVFLKQKNIALSRSQITQWISKEYVFINQSLCKKASYCLKTGDLIKVFIPHKKKQKLSPYDFPIDIVFEDKHILVVNKPAGIVVHPAPGNEDKTLVNILFHKKNLSAGSHFLRPGVVHRLDKNVSGLLLLTKTQEAQNHLILQFKNHLVRREYWAVVLHPPCPLQGSLESWIIRHPVHRKKFMSVKKFQPGANKAISFYKLFCQHESGLSWVKCHLQTGRTHQIRVHLSSLSCPIVGDEVYGGTKKLSFIKNSTIKEEIKSLNRIALHSHSLSFQHPLSKKTISFKSMWPSDLKSFIKTLNFKNF